jgi:anti-sigma factor RsiW
MNRFDEHAEIRGQLALFIAGALDADAEAHVARHTSSCPACAAELERWQLISGGLRRLPTPQPSPALFERARALAAAQLAVQAEQRQTRMLLIPLIVFSWAVTVAGWPLFRFATAGLLSLLDIRFGQIWLLFAIFTSLTWIVGTTAAVLLSIRRRQEGRFA